MEEEFLIRDGVLMEYRGEAEHVILPDGVSEIYAYAFKFKNMSSVTVPCGVNVIGKGAFCGC